jgi:hypothetical protein
MGIEEAGKGAADQMYAALQQGLQNLNFVPTTFQTYTRVILPLDKSVFWLPTVPLVVDGSLHYSQEILQNEDETYGQAVVIFTTQDQIVEFSASPINVLYTSRIGNFRFAFAQQQGFYSQAGLWHYFGHSIPPAMTTQLLDDPSSIDPSQAVVSNSLPLWLALNNYTCPYFDGWSNSIPLFPSDLVDPNQVPPYGVIVINEEDTLPIQSVPLVSLDRSSMQLASDTVKVILYGLQNNAAIDFLNCVLRFTTDTNYFGIMNRPIVTDAKRTQAELQAVGMKKVIDFQVSYYQARADSVARELIKKALATYTFEQTTL